MNRLRACCLLSRRRRLAPPRPAALPPAGPKTVRVEVTPGLLPDLPRDRETIAKLIDEGCLYPICAEGAMNMDGACDGFPSPTPML